MLNPTKCSQGKVQGVFFRANTEAAARDLDLRGWCHNMPDGESVEGVAVSDDNESIEKL